ncbi:hypothetical protein BDQ17DRAFT_1333506 [Cyathus striatus]|nr:hypothetical protein BDQ17DRAFT_1333506 [Cyathus striatus]
MTGPQIYALEIYFHHMINNEFCEKMNVKSMLTIDYFKEDFTVTKVVRLKDICRSMNDAVDQFLLNHFVNTEATGMKHIEPITFERTKMDNTTKMKREHIGIISWEEFPGEHISFQFEILQFAIQQCNLITEHSNVTNSNEMHNSRDNMLGPAVQDNQLDIVDLFWSQVDSEGSLADHKARNTIVADIEGEQQVNNMNTYGDANSLLQVDNIIHEATNDTDTSKINTGPSSVEHVGMISQLQTAAQAEVERCNFERDAPMNSREPNSTHADEEVESIVDNALETTSETNLLDTSDLLLLDMDVEFSVKRDNKIWKTDIHISEAKGLEIWAILM